MKLIPKDAVLAEIEKIIADETESIKCFERRRNVSEVQRSNARIGVLTHLRSRLNTLEVKEVDLKKEFSQWWKSERAKDYNVDVLYEMYSNVSMKLAKHFFELGLKVSNPLTWEDIKILQEKSSEVFAEVAKGKVEYYSIYPTQQSFLEEVLKRFKALKEE